MIVGLAGMKGSGKDTVAAYLVKMHGFERKAFADPLKNSVAALFGIEFSHVDQLKNNPDARVQLVVPLGKPPRMDEDVLECTFREFLQRYGTESHRDVFGEDFWLDYTLPVQGFYPGRAICVTDVRFANEAHRIHVLGGTVWMIERPDIARSDPHSSENMDFKADQFILNNGSIDDLYIRVEVALSATAIATANS